MHEDRLGHGAQTSTEKINQQYRLWIQPGGELMREVRNYIGGRWEERNGQSTEAVYGPATGAVIADTPSLLSHARFLANTIR